MGGSMFLTKTKLFRCKNIINFQKFQKTNRNYFLKKIIMCLYHPATRTVLAVGKFPVSHGIPQIPTGDIMSRQFCGNHPCLKISVIIPGRQPCPMVITEMFRNGPYYHGTQCVPREFVGYRETRETFPPPILYVVVSETHGFGYSHTHIQSYTATHS